MERDIIPGLITSGDSEEEAYEMFYRGETRRIISPLLPNAEKAITEIVHRWNKNGTYWGFFTGVFDMTHPNHFWAIIRARIETTKAYAESIGVRFDHLDTTHKIDLVASNKVALLVSINGDEVVLNHKGYKHGEIGTIRPVLPWASRALLASTIMLPRDKGLYTPVIDLITAHDSISFKGRVFESHLKLGKQLKPDCWIVASDNVKNEQNILKLGIGTKLLKIEPGTIINPFTEKPYSTSDTIARLFKNKL